MNHTARSRSFCTLHRHRSDAEWLGEFLNRQNIRIIAKTMAHVPTMLHGCNSWLSMDENGGAFILTFQQRTCPACIGRRLDRRARLNSVLAEMLNRIKWDKRDHL